MRLLYNLLIVAYYFVPIWAFLIWRYVRFDSPRSLITIEALLLAATVWLAYHPMNLPKITHWLHWYTFFLMAYILLLTTLFGYHRLHKILALSLWMIFIAGDFWELPVFIYDGFGWVNGFHTWQVDVWTWMSSHIHRAYVFVTALLMIRLAHLKLTYNAALLTGTSFFLSFVGLYPWSTYYPQTTLIHITSLSLFGFIVYFAEPEL